MPHFDEQAERSIIVAICVTDHASQIFRDLTPEDFYSTIYAGQFERLGKAYTEGTLIEMTAKMMDSGLTAPDRVIAVFDAVRVVRNHSIRRTMDKAVDELTAMTGDYAVGVGSIHDRFKELAVEVMDARVCKVPSKTKDDIAKFRAARNNDARAFVTGIESIDQKAAIQPSDFVVIAARPAVGKSALAATFLRANFLGPERHRGIFISIEMDLKQVYARIVSQMSNIKLTSFLNSHDFPMTPAEELVAEVQTEYIEKEFPERWFQQGTATLPEIQQVVELERPDFIMIDYVQIIKHESKFGDRERLDGISMFLRQLGLDFGVAVIVLAQLNRDSNGNAPQISHIKGSGQFEQDATHILLLDRPESERGVKQQARNYQTHDGHRVTLMAESGVTNMAALLINKNRNGPPFYELLNFNPKTTAFTPFE